MQNSALSETEKLHNWAFANTQHRDLVASWEELLVVYDNLRFTDPVSDELRMIEFKDIIGEVNKFLTKTRKALLDVQSVDAALGYLQSVAFIKDSTQIKTRKALAYQKLKQQWIFSAIAFLESVNEIGGEEDDE